MVLAISAVCRVNRLKPPQITKQCQFKNGQGDCASSPQLSSLSHSPIYRKDNFYLTDVPYLPHPIAFLPHPIAFLPPLKQVVPSLHLDLHPLWNKYSWTWEWNYLANTSLKITQGPCWLQWQLYLSVFRMGTTQCSSGSWAQRLCVDAFFIVMQESHSRAYSILM